MARPHFDETSIIPSRATRSRPSNIARTVLIGSRRNHASSNMHDQSPNKLRILQIAANEFARKGYDGARVDEIVRRSKVSKNLIYHYFDSKDALFVAVLERAYTKLRKRQQSMGLERSDPIEGISKPVIDSFKYWEQSKHFIAYLNSENFYNAKHIKNSKVIRGTYPALIESIRSVLRRGEEQGVFRSGVDPIDLYISISALGYHFFSNQNTFWSAAGTEYTELYQRP